MERRVAARVRSQRWYLRFPRGAPVGIFLLVSAITALSVYAIEQVESQRVEAQRRQSATAVTASMERLVVANAIYLKAGSVLLSMQPTVTPAAFQEFAGQIESDAALRGGGALAYLEVVPADGIAALERKMQLAGEKSFRAWPGRSHGTALVATFIAPNVESVRRALGYDHRSEPVRSAAIDVAIATAQPTATGAIQLKSDPTMKNASGFGMYMPVYRGSGPGREFRGMLARAFDSRRFLKAALDPAQMPEYGVAMYDAEAHGRPLIASYGPQAEQKRRIRREVVLAGHHMSVEISPPAATTLSNLSLLTLLFGMMVAALLLVLARMVTQQAAEDRAALAWFEEQASIRNSLTRELNHRVKNTLANVLSIVSLTRRRTDNIDEFVRGLIGRVRALSATHDLLTQSEWGTTPIRAVVDAELAPYTHDGDRMVSLTGPQVELAPNDALSLGLAVHELATNASKYGALSTPGGRLDVDWDMISDKLARVRWAESGGPPVADNRRRGFGTELIEKIVAHELKNPVDLQFRTEGVTCTLIVPVRAPAAFQLRSRAR